MNDMSQVIIPKSDQINAETLLAGPKTVTIKAVHISGGQEQPVSIELEETHLVYRPCKSMSRVLVAAWGPDAKVYVGRSLTLYRDPSVKWGGLEVGGIRISHMSHIDTAMTMALTATKGSRKPYTVKVLAEAPKQQDRQEQTSAPANGRAKAESWLASYEADLKAATTMDELERIHSKADNAVAKLAKEYPDLHEKALVLRPKTQPPVEDDPFATAAEQGDLIGADQ